MISRDHPRSRGVYRKEHQWPLRSPGSSPLARGLRPADTNADLAVGIIPARAGFTARHRSEPVTRWDHPRSRGVYDGGERLVGARLGSSPLARGLQPVCHTAPMVWGIIPARAGFTANLRGPHAISRDHPRSRGVYLFLMPALRSGMGSSPLARGLHAERAFKEADARIIPARAGFTAFPESPLGKILGSSPLARGLLGAELRHVHDAGIIPARAGFTSVVLVAVLVAWDHPRSRGVYVELVPVDRGAGGSSPLARGLHRGITTHATPRRIIPARAGFTLGDRRDSNGGPPYQGAFAFTGDLGTARLSCGSVVAGQRSTTTPSPV